MLLLNQKSKPAKINKRIRFSPCNWKCLSKTQCTHALNQTFVYFRVYVIIMQKHQQIFIFAFFIAIHCSFQFTSLLARVISLQNLTLLHKYINSLEVCIITKVRKNKMFLKNHCKALELYLI